MEISKQNFWFSLKILQILRFMMIHSKQNKTNFRVKCVISRTRVHIPTIFIGDFINKKLTKLLINC